MNSLVRAKRRDGLWHLQHVRGGEFTPEAEAWLRQCLPLGQEINLAAFRALEGHAAIWQLELTKAALDDGEIALGVAAAFAKQCSESPEIEHVLCAPSSLVSRRTIARALIKDGQRVAHAWLTPVLDVLQFTLATLTALVFWIATVLRASLERREVVPHADTVLAVHGEWSNRTRHVLRLGTGREAQVVLVLGRPRCELRQLAQMWSVNAGLVRPVLLRPFSVGSAVRSLPRSVKLCLAGARLVTGQAYKPPFSAQVAMTYRCLLGGASAAWWQASGIRSRVSVYGHTGLADTTLLEAAQQASGVTTVHAVHGVSAGLNFVGRSNLAVFRCAHDATWHRALGGYGDCRAWPTVRPGAVRGGKGILFLSNLLHPMNPWFRAFGASDELHALAQVAAVADEIGVPRGEVVWKPHPVFNSFSPELRQRVLRRVGELGLRSWPDGAPLGEAVDYAVVLSTRSTAALDVLSLGLIPVILESRAMAVSDAVSCFPYQARNPAEAVRAITMLDSERDLEAIHQDCWRRIGPAEALHPQHLFHLTA
jgi:hypothetical protein